MFDIGWQELFVIAAVALIVVGPKDLPQALRAVAGVVRKARSLARDFQGSIDQVMREAELDELRRKVNEARQFDLKAKVGEAIDPTGRLLDDFDPADFARDLQDRVEKPQPSRGSPRAPVSRKFVPPEPAQPDRSDPALAADSGEEDTDPATRAGTGGAAAGASEPLAQVAEPGPVAPETGRARPQPT